MNFKNIRFPKRPLELLSVQEMDELSEVGNTDERKEVADDDILPILDVSSSLPNRAKKITAKQLVEAFSGEATPRADLTLSNLSDYNEARSNLGTFSTVADVQVSHIPAELESIRTLGWNAPGDGGGALLIEGSSSDPGAIQDADGKWWRVAEKVVRPQMFGAKGDGTTDDTTALQAAIDFAMLTGRTLYWPAGEYRKTASLDGFWDVQHEGEGKILHGNDVWHITPVDNQRNILYVTQSGNGSNDGLTPDNSLTAVDAANRFRKIGSKALNGYWRIQLLGNLSLRGMRIINWPTFANYVEIFGEEVPLTSVPTTVWDGTDNDEAYAIRAANSTSLIWLHFKNIKFINWDNGSAQSGGIVAQSPGGVLTENCHAENCPGGFRYNVARVRHLYGVIKNASSQAIAATYHATINVGNLSGGGVTFEDCDRGVSVGRSSVAYIQGSKFNGEFVYCIEVNRNSRIRTQANDFRQATWTGSAIDVSLNSVKNDDNNSGHPDLYPTLSRSLLATRAIQGSVNAQVHLGSARTLHAYSSNTFSLPDPAGAVHLRTQDASWVPFRIPGYYMYDPTAVLDVEIVIGIGENTSGELALYGQGSGSALKLASVSIPQRSGEGTFRGRVFMRVYNTGSTDTARALVEVPGLGIYTDDYTVSLDNEFIRNNSEDKLQYRLYWTPETTGFLQFINMRTYVEA